VSQSALQELPSQHVRTYRYYDLIMAAFVTVLLCSNLIGPAKLCVLFGFTFGAGNLFFPISYIFGDILTEVYGYARSRKVIWAGFGAILFASFMSYIVINLPSAGGSQYQNDLQNALVIVFGSTPRIIAASILAFWIGEFTNSFVMAKMKLLTRGRFLWSRTIGSTAVGQGVDTLVFYPLAFWGIWTNEQLLLGMFANYTIKVVWEVANTPITYAVVAFLKRAEQEDYYDRDTNFNPFSLKD
jgi:uncharacterized integral membrane protein (TIGR00697 family)